MLKLISSHVFLRSRLHPGLLDTLDRTGADGVELFAARQHLDYTSPEAVRELAEWFASNPLRPFSMHAPLWSDAESGRGGEPSVNVVHPDKGRRIAAMDEIRRALEIAERIPLQHIVIHLGDRGDAWDERSLADALTALEHLQAYARPLGVRLLVENIPNEIATPAHLGEILRVGHFDDIGVCLDTGHAHMGEGVPAALAELAPLLRTAHLHDNHGERDEHLWPGEGSIDFDAVYAGLAAAPQTPAGVLEIHYSYGAEPGLVVERAKAAFERFPK